MRKLALTVLAVAGLALVAFGASDVLAKPPGLKGDSDIGKLLFKFNVLAKPNAWNDVGNSCQGHRIFFSEGSGGGGKTIGTILWTLDPTKTGPDFEIDDCNGTLDDMASVLVDENQFDFLVAIRVLGKKTHVLKFRCDRVVVNPTVTGNEDLCLIDGIKNIAKGKEFTKVMQNIADDEMESVLWDLDGTWKVFDVRIYEWLNQ